MAAIIASVAPQVTVTCVSGSIAPQAGKWRAVDSAIASRSGFEPHVIAYWLMSASTAAATAAFSSGGQAKSGKPWARLTAPAATARRFISRMTDSVNRSAFAEMRGRVMSRESTSCSDQGAGYRPPPRPTEERLTIDIHLEIGAQMERLRVARLDRVCPDLRVGLVIVPAVDDVGVHGGAGRIGVRRGHRQGLGRVEAAAVVEDVLAAVVDGDARRPGDHVVGDAPAGFVCRALAADVPESWSRRLEGGDGEVTWTSGRWHDREDEP